MAALLIATPFVHSNAFGSNAMIANVRGFQGQLMSRGFQGQLMSRGFQDQKMLRMACPWASISAAQRADASKTAVRQIGVTVLQSLSSPLLNLSPADLIAAFLEEETHEEAQRDLITALMEEETHKEAQRDLIAAFTEKEMPEEAQRAGVAQPLKKSEPVPEVQVARRRSGRVVFTEEKARRLRQENRATQTFHDKWYHSAIASRLAAPE